MARIHYTPELAADICEQIASGKSLVRVCKTKKIGYSTVTDWLRERPEFAVNYAQAREAQADFLADELVDIADDEKLHPDSRRVRIDARKWKAGKMKPKVYGDKMLHAGPDGETPATFTLNIDRRDKDV
jgi:hypothetical protein